MKNISRSYAAAAMCMGLGLLSACGNLFSGLEEDRLRRERLREKTREHIARTKADKRTDHKLVLGALNTGENKEVFSDNGWIVFDGAGLDEHGPPFFYADFNRLDDLARLSNELAGKFKIIAFDIGVSHFVKGWGSGHVEQFFLLLTPGGQLIMDKGQLRPNMKKHMNRLLEETGFQVEEHQGIYLNEAVPGGRRGAMRSYLVATKPFRDPST